MFHKNKKGEVKKPKPGEVRKFHDNRTGPVGHGTFTTFTPPDKLNDGDAGVHSGIPIPPGSLVALPPRDDKGYDPRTEEAD